MSGAALGLWLTGLRQRARIIVPLSAGVLLGVAIFGLLPELISELARPEEASRSDDRVCETTHVER